MQNPQTQPENSVNIASHLPAMAGLQPYQRAVVYPSGHDYKGRVAYSHLTFAQLDQESDAYAHGLEKFGVTRGTRTILMVKPSLEFFALTFALFKVGAVPVLIDPGMGIKRLLHCLQQTRSEAFIGIPLAQALRVLFPKYFQSVRTNITVGKRVFWGGPTLKDLRLANAGSYNMAPTQADETAAILFTTGSTGPAKGAVYQHGMFDAQVRALKEQFGIKPGEMDLPTFPLFALFAPALGMTAVIPDMDPTKPALVNPLKIIEAIHNQGITNMFASPALLNRVVRYAGPRKIKLPSLRRIISAGAPVPHVTLEKFREILSKDAKIYTPYGATESLPVSIIESQEILSQTKTRTSQGDGICVGKAVKGMQLRVIKIQDGPINVWSDDLLANNGTIGEIVVQGPVVTQEYFEKPDATALAKIQMDDKVWHRMGDVGWLDDQERLWFCGRKGHRVICDQGVLFSSLEEIFNQHPRVYRSAPGRHRQSPSSKTCHLY